MTAMSRRLLGVLLVVFIAIIVVVVLGRKDRPKQRSNSDETVTAPVTRPPRQWKATTASEQAPPPSCAPAGDGGFSCGACRGDMDCPPGRSCFVNLESGRTECQGSECTKNEDCPPSMLCRVVSRTARGEPLHGCVLSGTRPAGAACDPDNAGDPSVSCTGSLLCVQGGCAPSCVENEFPERNACAGEVPCVNTDNGWGCVPSCKHGPKDSCRDGKVCEFLSVEDPTALCIHKVGANCLGSKGGCPAGTECLAETDARTERTTFACHPKCDPAAPSCSPGFLCVPGKPNSHCRRGCSPGQGSGCPEGERCKKTRGAAPISYCSPT
jgi:hypothetical protein